jgi:hypothetical protein
MARLFVFVVDIHAVTVYFSMQRPRYSLKHLKPEEWPVLPAGDGPGVRPSRSRIKPCRVICQQVDSTL